MTREDERIMAIESWISQLCHRECYIVILEAVLSVDRERQGKSHGYIFREGRDSEARTSDDRDNSLR